MIDKIVQVYQDKVLYKQWLLEEGFTITYDKIFEWDSEKAITTKTLIFVWSALFLWKFA